MSSLICKTCGNLQDEFISGESETKKIPICKRCGSNELTLRSRVVKK